MTHTPAAPTEIEYLCRDPQTDELIVVRRPNAHHPRELYVDGKWRHIILDYVSRTTRERVLSSEDDRFRFGEEGCSVNGRELTILKPEQYSVVFHGQLVTIRQQTGTTDLS